MNAQTLKALRASIAHWERLASGKRRAGEIPGWRHCALCRSYLENSPYCLGCPVADAGHKRCVGTPYVRADIQAFRYGLNSSEFKSAAAKELAFLRGLLPKGRSK